MKISEPLCHTIGSRGRYIKTPSKVASQKQLSCPEIPPPSGIAVCVLIGFCHYPRWLFCYCCCQQRCCKQCSHDCACNSIDLVSPPGDAACLLLQPLYFFKILQHLLLPCHCRCTAASWESGYVDDLGWQTNNGWELCHILLVSTSTSASSSKSFSSSSTSFLCSTQAMQHLFPPPSLPIEHSCT